MPKNTGFVVKKARTHGTSVGIVTADIMKYVGVLNVSRERDCMFAALPKQNDVFVELHDTRRVSP